jgi:tetratricopeptide (TPR) repeat protein
MPQGCILWRSYLKPSLLLITFFFSLAIQAQSLEEKIAVEACACFEAASRHSSVADAMSELGDRCFSTILEKHKDEVMAKFNIRDTTDTDEAYKFGQQVAPAVMSQMILHCDKFFHYMDSARWDEIRGIDKTQVRLELKASDEKINSGQIDAENYFTRGMCYFLLKEFDHADIDFRTAIKLDEEFGPAYFYIGWIKEIQQDFEGAKTYYQRSADLTNQHEMIQLLLTLVERKQRDQTRGKH